MTTRKCAGCGEDIPTEDIYDYGDDEAHTVWAFAPYYSSESAGLPCGPIQLPVVLRALQVMRAGREATQDD